MYSLKEAWDILHGEEPVKNWQGKIYCHEEGTESISLINKLHGYVSTYSFVLVRKGTLKLLYNTLEITVQPDHLYLYSPGQTISVLSVTDDFQCISLIIDEQVTLDLPAVYDLVQTAYLPIVQLREPKMQLPHDVASRLDVRMQEIIRYLHSNHSYRYEILQMLYGIFLLDLQNAQDEIIVNRKVSLRVEEIFIAFMRLLPRHFVEHHDIDFYASQLNISKVYLSRAIRQASGGTVSDYINKALLIRASFLLQTSSLSISQIADELHFADASSFSKFFSRMKGCSPREYRESKGTR